MASVGSPEQSKHAKKGKKKKKRIGFRIDMAPMVDIAFLLLTFFMLTTTFSKPQTMEITMPLLDIETKVAESNLLTFSLLRGDTLYWSRGAKLPEYIPLYEIRDEKQLVNNSITTVVKEQRQEVITEIGEDNLAVILKFDKKAKYKNMIDIIDELNLMDMSRFSLSTFTDEERKALLSSISAETESLEEEKNRQ